MTIQLIIARRYAKGLSMSADLDSLLQTTENLGCIVDLWNSEKFDLRVFLENPEFTPLEKNKVVQKIFNKYEYSDELKKLFYLLIDKSRIKLLPFIYLALLDIVDSKLNRLRGKIFTSNKLLDEDIAAISNQLKTVFKKDILLTPIVDNSLIYGIKIVLGTWVFDSTVKSKLTNLQRKLLA